MAAFYRLLMAGSALSMVAAFACVMATMADRWFGLGLRGLDAYAGYAIASALFLALPATLQRGEHIRVTLLLQRLSPRWRDVLEAWCLAVGVALSAALAFYACRLVWVSWTTHDVSPASDATPLWLPQIAMAAGCIGLAMAMLEAAWRRWRGLSFEIPAAGASAPAHVE